ncbi:MAG TPA: hypothetical protein VM389_01390 [Phycisphaerae bacterium]|nr:hypothetical protein [Phycisphaerae bacterium]HUU60636.1 hypothetical protein [Phycisphaerae bacterium]
MAQKQKLFRIDANLASVFESWCKTRALKQEMAAEAALFQLIAMPPEEREELFVSLAELKTTLESAPSGGKDVGKLVAEALNRRSEATRAKRRQGRQSA